MNKITAEGPYQGKNVTVFTEDGTKVSKDAHERKKYLDSLKINMRDENDVESDSDEQQNYLKTVRSNLLKTKEEDTKLAKQKLKEKRIKSKKRQRGAQDGSDDEGVQLASDQSGELSELSQEPSESEQVDNSEMGSDQESSDEEPIVPPTKRQKLNAEDKVLALLKKQSLF